ncbi:hypothetical protein ACK30C_17675, partial [Aeromonas caviae]
MSKLLTLYALLAMGKIEPTWPKRNRPSDIPGQSPGDIWGSDRVLKEENAPSVVLLYGDGIHLTVAHKREWSYGFKPDNKT